MLQGGVRKEKYERIFEGDKRLVLRTIAKKPLKNKGDWFAYFEEFGELS